MAKVNVSYDTVTKEMVCTIDGNEVVDVFEAEFKGMWSYDNNELSGKYSMCIESGSKNEDGTMEFHRVCAAENGDIVEKEETKPSAVDQIKSAFSK